MESLLSVALECMSNGENVFEICISNSTHLDKQHTQVTLKFGDPQTVSWFSHNLVT